MALCQGCSRKDECREICASVKQEITGRGKTASRKPKTYPVDFSYLQDTHNSLNSFQVNVLKSIRSLTSDIKERVIVKLMVQEAISKTLNGKEKEVIRLFMEEYKQEEIAMTIGVSQPRVNFLIKRALKKLRNFLEQL